MRGAEPTWEGGGGVAGAVLRGPAHCILAVFPSQVCGWPGARGRSPAHPEGETLGCRFLAGWLALCCAACLSLPVVGGQGALAGASLADTAAQGTLALQQGAWS